MKLQDYKQKWDNLSEKKNLSGKEALKAVKRNGYALQFVNEQTPEICLEAVKQYGNALGYVINQTSEICLEAVKQDGYALRFVINQTPEICLEAVKEDGDALQYVNEDMFEEEDIVIDGKKFSKSTIKEALKSYILTKGSKSHL